MVDGRENSLLQDVAPAAFRMRAREKAATTPDNKLFHYHDEP